MKSLILFLGMISFSLNSWAQWAIPTQMRAENTLDRLSDKGGLSSSDLLHFW